MKSVPTEKESALLSGILTKQGLGWIYKPWYDRIFCLFSNDHLFLEYSTLEGVLRGRVHLNFSVATPCTHKTKSHTFVVCIRKYGLKKNKGFSPSSKTKELILNAKNDEERDKWIKILNEAIISYYGSNKNRNLPSFKSSIAPSSSHSEFDEVSGIMRNSRIKSVNSTRSITKEDSSVFNISNEFTKVLLSLQSSAADDSSAGQSIILDDLAAIIESIEEAPAANQGLLHNLGACDTIAAIMKQYLQLSLPILENCLKTIYKLCYCKLADEIFISEQNIFAFFSNGCFEDVCRALDIHGSEHLEIATQGLLCLGILFPQNIQVKFQKLCGIFMIISNLIKSQRNESLIISELSLLAIANTAKIFSDLMTVEMIESSDFQLFLDSGILEKVIEVMKLHWDSTVCIERGCVCILHFSCNDTVRAVLGKEGACIVVCDSLKHHLHDANVVGLCCGAIWALSNLESNHALLSNADACLYLVQCLGIYFIDDIDVIQRALLSIRCLSLNQDSLTSFLEVGLCNALIDILTTTDLQTNTAIISEVFLLMNHIATCDEDRRNQSKLLEGDKACEAILQAMNANIDSEDLVIQSCLLISNLSIGNNSNQLKLGLAGVCAVITCILTKYSSENENETHFAICEAAFDAIKHITFQSQNRLKFYDLVDFLPLFVRIMRCNAYSNAVLAHQGCRIVTMISLDDFGASELGNLGTCEIIVRLLKMAVQSDFIETLLRAVSTLSSMSGANSSRLGSAGVCPVLVKVFEYPGNIKDVHISEVCCTAAMFLSAPSYSSNAENRVKLGEAGICAVVCKALQMHVKSPSVVLKGCCAIMSLISSNKDSKRKFLDLNAVDIVQSILNIHKDASNIVAKGNEVIHRLHLQS